MEQSTYEFSKELWEKALEFYRAGKEQGYSVSFKNLQEVLGISERFARTIHLMLRNQDIISETHLLPEKKVAKRFGLFGDFHCGHYAGLTPPEYHIPLTIPGKERFASYQRETWNWFYNVVQKLKPFHGALFNGDLIDGRGERSGSTELITADRHDQADMAKHIIRMIGARHNFITLGTPYHSGQSEDFEREIADSVGAIQAGELMIDFKGVIINAKHKVGGSQTFGGQATAPLRVSYWVEQWSKEQELPEAHYVIRSHTHQYVNVELSDRQAIVLPALHGAMTKFGERQMDKKVDFGFGYIDLYADGTHEFKKVLYRPSAQSKELHSI